MSTELNHFKHLENLIEYDEYSLKKAYRVFYLSNTCGSCSSYSNKLRCFATSRGIAYRCVNCVDVVFDKQFELDIKDLFFIQCLLS